MWALPSAKLNGDDLFQWLIRSFRLNVSAKIGNSSCTSTWFPSFSHRPRTALKIDFIVKLFGLHHLCQTQISFYLSWILPVAINLIQCFLKYLIPSSSYVRNICSFFNVKTHNNSEQAQHCVNKNQPEKGNFQWKSFLMMQAKNAELVLRVCCLLIYYLLIASNRLQTVPT